MTTHPSSAPTVVGDYTLLTRLGEGGMGIVHLARHRDGRRVALKVLRPHIVGDQEARARLAREVSSLGRVRSPWVAEILDADPWAEVPFVVTRYVPGLSLHHYVGEEGVTDGEDLLWLAGCLAEGIAAVHEAGVLHRDVKPANVLMEGRTPILIDFGLARVADDPRLTQTGWLLGTPGYLAPEILYGDEPTPAVDMHAWAATVAWAATGRPPYGKGPSMAIMDRTRRGEHDLAGMSGDLAAVVDAALDPDPLARPLFDEVLAWLRPLTTRPESALGPLPVTTGLRADDDFTLPLAIANSGGALTPMVAAPAPATEAATAATVADPPTHTRMLTEQVPPPPGGRTALPPPPPTLGPGDLPTTPSVPPDARAMRLLEEQWDERYLAPPVPWLERMRRRVLVALGGFVVGAAIAAAPWVAAMVVVAVVWALRTGSLAASATADRRVVRGQKWYDGPRLVVTAPWHLLRGVTGTLILVLWSAGLGVAAGLMCYALHLRVAETLLVSGTVLGVALWSGPGSGRFRRPVSRALHPAAHRPLPWLLCCAGLLVVGATLALMAAGEVTWFPANGGPFGID